MATQATQIIDKNGKRTTVHRRVEAPAASQREVLRMPPPRSTFENSSVGLALAIGDAVDALDEGMESFFGTLLGVEDDPFVQEKRERAERRATRRAVRRSL
jgi:hypothetical protein